MPMTCAARGCFSPRLLGLNLCVRCQDKREAAVIVGVCIGISALIICAAKIGRLL